jgi:hypothetical protein
MVRNFYFELNHIKKIDFKTLIIKTLRKNNKKHHSIFSIYFTNVNF